MKKEAALLSSFLIFIHLYNTMAYLIRSFYPVGFGAFYMEVHKTANNTMTIVYDCGTKTTGVNIEKIIDDAFNGRDKVIDILFISHFHKDHISGIPYLRKNYTIRKVVIPYISKDNRMLFVFAEGVRAYQQMIIDTEGYFGEETEVLRILPEQGEEQIDERMDDMEGFERSGFPLHTSLSTLGWFLIPFNYNYAEKISELKKILCSEGLEYERLTEQNYIQSNYELILKAYRNIRNPNNTSLTLFSGLNRLGPYMFTFQNCNFNIIKGPNCLYLGDVTMNKKFMSRLQNRLNPYLNEVYTVQVPHHGAEKSFDSSILKPHSIAVICHEQGDPKHPSSVVVTNIKSSHSFPICVTEDRFSEFCAFGVW